MATRATILRFTTRRSIRAAGLWGLILGSYYASRTVGFVKAYPTQAGRNQLATTLGHNKGIEVLVGPPHSVATVAGYTAWNCLQIMVLIGAVWGLLLATKLLRGEEESGRWELLVSAPATARQATASVLRGMGVCLLAIYAILGILTLAIGDMRDVQIGASASLFFDLVVVGGIAVFVLLGACLSQVMPARSRAASAAAGIFGLCFALRAVGDITNAHWLLNLTPLGWIEKAQPLTGSHPIWLVPLFGLGALLWFTTYWLAGQRDYQASLVSEPSEHRPHLNLLSKPFGLAMRFSRTSVLSWLLALGGLTFFYSVLTKTAMQALKSTGNTSPAVAKILHESSLASAQAYLGAIFLIMLLVLMAFAANLAIAVRREEDRGYLDNLLVRPISRWRWLAGRLVFGAGVIIIAGLAMGLAAWTGVALQHLGVPLTKLLAAGINVAAAGLLAFGVGILAFGFWPRATSFVTYGVLLWSFLLNMLNSGIHLNHWLLDTSVLNQLSLVPAVAPNWQVISSMTLLGCLLALAGAIRFNRRDLVTE